VSKPIDFGFKRSGFRVNVSVRVEVRVGIGDGDMGWELGVMVYGSWFSVRVMVTVSELAPT